MGSSSSFLTAAHAAHAAFGRFVVVLALLTLTLAPIEAADAPTAVVISSFTAVYGAGNAINVQWVTESEVDLALFILTRGETPLSQSQPGTQVYQITPQAGGGIGQYTYTFSDTGSLVQGVSYYYMLRVLETGGFEQFFYANGSQPVVFGVTPTPTATVGAGATATPTPTATVGTGATVTPTPTATVGTGATATPTRTPSPFNTSTPLPTFTPTTAPTLVPGIVTNTPPAGATNTPVPTLIVPPPIATPLPPTSTLSPFDTPTVTTSVTVTAVGTLESPTPLVAEASSTEPPPPPAETPTRLPPRTQAEATATPESSAVTRNTAATGLLLCLGGGAIFGAGLLAIVGFVLWRRQPNVDDGPDDRR